MNGCERMIVTSGCHRLQDPIRGILLFPKSVTDLFVEDFIPSLYLHVTIDSWKNKDEFIQISKQLFKLTTFNVFFYR